MHDPKLTTYEPCTCNLRHMPVSRVNHRHHVWPLGKGGPDIPENVVVICPTGHYNTHELLREYEIAQGNPSRAVVQVFSRTERRLAKLGWERMQRKAM